MEPAQAPSSYTAAQTGTVGNILCCMCGTPIQPNPSSMCVTCLRSQVDITEGIPKQQTIFFCKGCDRYLRPPWIQCELESRELLTLCLRKIKQPLSKVKLIDASFLWTEPHSRRIKVKLVIQKEVFNGTILQQEFVVEYVVAGQQCDDCQRSYTLHIWKAMVQVRQKVPHKRTIFYLEQLIMKHKAQEAAIQIKETPGGLDFFFNHRSPAQKFLDFLNQCVPIRHKSSKELISQDDKSNTYNYKYTFLVEIANVCKDDLICLPPRTAAQNGNITPLVLCHRISSMLHYVDPLGCQTFNMISTAYWRTPFTAIMSSKQLIEFTVLDVVPLGPTSGKFVLAEATVARSSDLGVNDTIFQVNTHLGHILCAGDYAMGYDLTTANFNDSDVRNAKIQLPDIVLVKKFYPSRKQKNSKRPWMLKKLNKQEEEKKRGEEEQEHAQYEDFLQDLEDDPELRSQINLYKDPSATHTAEKDEDDDAPEVGLEELLDDMTLQDADADPDDDEMA